MNNRVTELLLASLREVLAGEELRCELIAALEPKEWGELLKLAQQHNILPLLCDALTPHKAILPREVFARLVGMTLVAEDRYELRVEVIARLAAVLAEADIPLMLLKGYGISRYYPMANHRTFSDVDIYNCGRIEEADRTLAEKLGVEIETDVHHHTKCVYKGVLIENHYDFVNTSAHSSDVRFERILKQEVAKDIRHIEVRGADVMLPSATFNALFLMRHMAHHYAAERVSLRHLADWKQFIESEHTNVDWASVHRLYTEFNMKRFADAVTGLCVSHLGMRGDLIEGVERDEKLEQRILADIIYAEFDEQMPGRGFVRIVWWKIRRFVANRWKHKLVYNESWLRTFFHSAIGHLRKPHTIAH